MVQYQSFPDSPGDSRTLDKLKALMLPDLAGARFLDVGCNEGFFCGFAAFQGARESIGLDHSQVFIARARARFPDCKFLVQGWERLPKAPFDVILLASALHYAEDQPQLVHRLVARLSVDGVLVLEVGIVPSKKAEFVKVKRGSDERWFPTMLKMREILRPYAWKWMGPSVAQEGDPVARHVFHIRRRRRLACLLLQPPGFGKTTIAASLFKGSKVPVVSTDTLLDKVHRGTLDASAPLRKALKADYSPFHIDQVVQRLFADGLAPDLLRLWLSQAGPRDFALEGYVPPQYHADIRQGLVDAGYLPVTLDWQPQGRRLLPPDVSAGLGEAFYRSLLGKGAKGAKGAPAVREPAGFVDELVVERGRLFVRGWAIDVHGELPAQFAVRLDGRTVVVEAVERQLRVDVQRHMKLTHGLVGYRFSIPLDKPRPLRELAAGLKVFAVEAGYPVDSPFHFAAAVAGAA